MHYFLGVAYAKGLHKLMAYKDEYEVARLYVDPAFTQKLREQFEGEPGKDYQVHFHLAPPLLAKKNDKGELVKQLGAVDFINRNEFAGMMRTGKETPEEEPQAEVEEATYEGLDRAHARNFLDCVKSRRTPNADVEVGHRSTTFALLANIALATKSRLDWDAVAERFTNNDPANELLDYEYRAPWSHA